MIDSGDDMDALQPTQRIDHFLSTQTKMKYHEECDIRKKDGESCVVLWRDCGAIDFVDEDIEIRPINKIKPINFNIYDFPRK